MTAPLVIVGDLLLDVDRVGRSERLSPEAPVPVLVDVVDWERPGGAGLAGLLAARTAGRPVILVAPVADDDGALRLRRLLAGVVELVELPWTGATAVKTRLRIGDHPVARIDEGGGDGNLEVGEGLDEVLDSAGAVLVADYGGPAAADARIRSAIQRQVGRVPVVWDPHPRGSRPVPGVTLATPNRSELEVWSARSGLGAAPARTARDRDGQRFTAGSTLGATAAGAAALGTEWQVRGLVVTLGDRGAMLVEGAAPPMLAPAQRVNAGDTCGAGDMFAVTVALALADGAVLSEAVMSAVLQSGAFVAAGGAAGLVAGDADVACGGSSAESRAGRGATSTRPGVVVATGGCFDLLHAGHVATLEAARALGDRLVVCLNSDDSVRRLKGPGRPLQPAADRARVLSGLQAVDEVLIFDEDTPEAVLRTLQPDIWVKGGDYAGLELPEHAVLAEWGGVAVTVPYLAGRSTTALVTAAGISPSAAQR